MLASFKVGDEPEGVNIRPDGRVVYVTSEGDNQVAAIDAVNLKLLKTFEVGPRPRSTAFLPDSSRAYVPSENGASIAVIDAKTHRVLETIKLEGGPTGSPDGDRRLAGRQAPVRHDRAWQERAVHRHQNQQAGRAGRGRRSAVGHRRLTGRQTVFTANGPSNDVSFIDVEGARSTRRSKPANAHGVWCMCPEQNVEQPRRTRSSRRSRLRRFVQPSSWPRVLGGFSLHLRLPRRPRRCGWTITTRATTSRSPSASIAS